MRKSGRAQPADKDQLNRATMQFRTLDGQIQERSASLASQLCLFKQMADFSFEPDSGGDGALCCFPVRQDRPAPEGPGSEANH
mmetsp:Transcript_14432/g.30308  ORF Transcript_14432/g.30308 Transcript_14432/m.30308 type:complete len:83 (-) Transcript_14432:171-419(-)